MKSPRFVRIDAALKKARVVALHSSRPELSVAVLACQRGGWCIDWSSSADRADYGRCLGVLARQLGELAACYMGDGVNASESDLTRGHRWCRAAAETLALAAEFACLSAIYMERARKAELREATAAAGGAT